MADAKDAKAESQAAPKTKKINRLKPAEIDAKLDDLRTAQGGLKSKYAHQLILRKKVLGK
jgi:hypothetical protein